jgi:hypothetical protein
MNKAAFGGSRWIVTLRRAAIPVLMLAFATAITAPALAEIRILSSGGGSVGEYLNFFAKVRQSGERVVIDGPCLSACTLVLSAVPRNRICVTSKAVLGFHAPYLIDKSGRKSRSREATRAVNAAYPPGVRTWIKRNGGLTQKTILLRGRELSALYPRC